MLRVKWRELETGSRTSPAGHEGGNPGYRQGMFYRVTAPALDPASHLQDLGNAIIRSHAKIHHLFIECGLPGENQDWLAEPIANLVCAK